MILGPVFERFLNESPISVMSRATIEHALSAPALDALFERTAERGYTRELLFSTTVDLMSLVVCGTVPHVQSAYKHLLEGFDLGLMCSLGAPRLIASMQRPGIHTGRSCSRTDSNAPPCTSDIAHSTPPPLPVPSTSYPTHTTAASPAPCTPPPSPRSRSVRWRPPGGRSPSDPHPTGS